MADTYYICSDNIDGNENSRINALCDALKKKGHEAINGGVGPNTIQSHGQTSGSNGQIGAFICGGVDIQVFWDFVQGITNGYYHYKRFIYVYASDTATSDKWLTCNGAKNTPTVQAHDDNYSGGQGDAIGKTVHQYCSEHKDIIWYACGKLGCSFDEVIQNFLSGIGAGDNEEEGSSASSIKDVIKELLYAWDGEAECRVVNEYVYINKIPVPEEKYRFNFVEGVNIATDSINITDVNPDTINFLTVHWQGGEDIVYRDEKLIERFGEKPMEVDAVKKVLVEESGDSDNDNEKKSSSSTDTDTDSSSDVSKDADDKASDKDKEKESSSSTEEVPVETLEEAEAFAKLEWAKIKRDNGHSIEFKTIGSEKWLVGAWSRVVIPSFDIDDYMYISRLSQSESSSEWGANITLVDYPPSFGKYENENEEGEEEEAEEETDATAGDVSTVTTTE